jgi:hypothetical protein
MAASCPLTAFPPGGRVDAIIYRTGLSDKDVLRILAKYGIEANLEDLAKGVSG